MKGDRATVVWVQAQLPRPLKPLKPLHLARRAADRPFGSGSWSAQASAMRQRVVRQRGAQSPDRARYLMAFGNDLIERRYQPSPIVVIDDRRGQQLDEVDAVACDLAERNFDVCRRRARRSRRYLAGARRRGWVRLLGPTVGLAVAVVDVPSRQCSMTLEFCKSEGRRIMRCGMNGWCDRRGQRHRERQREAENLYMNQCDITG